MIKYIHKAVTIGDLQVAYHVPVIMAGTTLHVHSWQTLEAMRDQVYQAVTSTFEVPPEFDLEQAAELLVADAGLWLHEGTIHTTLPTNFDLQKYKNQAWERIKAERDAREFGSFTWDGSTFDCDDVSQRRIQGAAQLAMIAVSAGQPFETPWTLADNTVRVLSGADMIQVGLALGQHVASLHAVGRALRQQINAAGSPESVDTVTWPE